jgi:hypothetical protein
LTGVPSVGWSRANTDGATPICASATRTRDEVETIEFKTAKAQTAPATESQRASHSPATIRATCDAHAAGAKERGIVSAGRRQAR